PAWPGYRRGRRPGRRAVRRRSPQIGVLVVAGQVAGDERALRDDPQPPSPYRVQRPGRERAAQALALERRIHLGMGEHDPVAVVPVLGEPGQRVLDVHLVAVPVGVVDDAAHISPWTSAWAAGMVPRRPAWKSSKAWISSALVFITNGPYAATGSRIGCPPSSRTSSVWRGSAATVTVSPSP